MTIKELAYSAQQHLQIRTGSSFKRAHIYELLAALFGFNSYAALCSEAVFVQRRSDANHSSQNNFAIRQRCVELGYQPATAEIISSELPAFVAERQIDIVKLSALIAELRRNFLLLGEDSEWDEDDQQDGDPNDIYADIWYDPYDREVSPILLDGLETAASKGNALAHYALALAHAPHEDDFDHQVGSSYWYSQAQEGRVLTGVEKKWADAYAQQLVKGEKFAFHIREAARLGNKHALLDLAERFDDPSFFEKDLSGIDDHPVRIAEIAENLGRMEDARHWLTIAAEAGDTGAMRRLIEEFDYDDLQQCWIWLYLARLVGTDLTKNEYRAIHEDGSDYDDDVGGPIYLAGQDGVELVALDAVQDAAAQHAAEELLKRIQQEG